MSLLRFMEGRCARVITVHGGREQSLKSLTVLHKNGCYLDYISILTKSPPDALVALSEGSFCPVPRKTYLSVEIWIKVLVLQSWLLDGCFRGPVNI